jgi:hypothetical protein
LTICSKRCEADVLKASLDVRIGSGAGAAVIEIVATLLTVKMLTPMSGLEHSVPKVD